MMTKERLVQIISDYFDIGSDSYAYHLTRSKEAFGIGTMTLDDFTEFDEETAVDLAEYILKAL